MVSLGVAEECPFQNVERGMASRWKMAHKIRVTKNDNVEYLGNVFLTITLIIGLIFFILGYLYSIYVRLNLFDILSHNLTTHIILYFLLGFGTLAIEIISVILIVIDGNNLNIGRGLNHPGQRLFKSKTWYIHRWAILIFFFWIIFYPLYVYRRREIYEINKDFRPPLPESKSMAYKAKRNRIITIISIVILITVIISSVIIYSLFENNGKVSINSVSFTPGTPNEGDIITITTHLDGNLFLKAPQFSFDVIYDTGVDSVSMVGSRTMSKETEDTFVRP